tara:strand:- start:800 stop:1582 length:783 start_codon:yes stop_codon:yes gene_type:complete
MRENLKYLIVGDTIIDETIDLMACGLSLESPTIKTVPHDYHCSFGGSANVAKFLSSFGRKVSFATSMEDNFAADFEKKYPDIKLLNFYQGRNNKKTRFWIRHGDSRYKHLQINNVNDEDCPSFLPNIDINDYDIIAFSDYRCGFIKSKFIKHVTDSGKITYASSQISSRESNYDRYFDVDYIVCNKKESKYVDRKINICITTGDKGCIMNGVTYKVDPVKDPVNTIGAGDCFYAALLATGDPNFANLRASEYVSNDVKRN